MHHQALEKAQGLEVTAKKERQQKKILLSDTTKAMNEAQAFFEAYLNAFYSLLQILAKVTPSFYQANDPAHYRATSELSESRSTRARHI